MKKTRAAKRSKNVILRVAVIALSVYMVVSLGITASEIAAKESELAAIEKQTEEQHKMNAALKVQTENASAYQEQKAREQGMLKPGETMYIEIAND